MKKFSGLFLLIVFHFFILIHSMFTVWPEMILYPYFLNHGFKLYTDIVNPYFPLLTLTLSYFFKIFSESVLTLKIFTYLIILICDLVVFLSCFKISRNFLKSLICLLAFILLQFSFEGNGLWFELLLSPFLILTILLPFLNLDKKNAFLSGIFLSICILIKQNSAFFLIPILFLLLSKKKFREIIFLLAPILIFGLGLIWYLMTNGIFYDFYKWAILLPLTLGKQSGFVLLPALHQYLLILFPAVVLIATWTGQKSKVEKIYLSISILIALSFAFPRYEDFHLQAIVALSAVLLSFANKKFITIFLIISFIIFGRSFIKIFNQPDRFIDDQTLTLAGEIKNFPSVYLLNAPELSYFFANKLPPKPWATNFPWYFEENGFQDYFILSFKSEKFEYVVIGQRVGGGKYDLGNYLPEKFFEYIQKNYTLKENLGEFKVYQR